MPSAHCAPIALAMPTRSHIGTVRRRACSGRSVAYSPQRARSVAQRRHSVAGEVERLGGAAPASSYPRVSNGRSIAQPFDYHSVTARCSTPALGRHTSRDVTRPTKHVDPSTRARQRRRQGGVGWVESPAPQPAGDILSPPIWRFSIQTSTYSFNKAVSCPLNRILSHFSSAFDRILRNHPKYARRCSYGG